MSIKRNVKVVKIYPSFPFIYFLTFLQIIETSFEPNSHILVFTYLFPVFFCKIYRRFEVHYLYVYPSIYPDSYWGFHEKGTRSYLCT